MNGFQNKTKNAKRRNARKRGNQNQLVILNESGRFMPSQLRCILRYTDTVTQRANVGLAFMNYRYRSSAFDPDPLVLSGAIPGFTELAVFYRYYIVRKMRLILDVANQETVGVIVTTWPSNQDYGNNTLTAAQVMEYSGNPDGKSQLLASTSGMNRQRFILDASLDKIYPRVGMTDLDYSGLTSGNPTVQYYINIGATPCIGTFGFPLSVRALIEYHIEFYAPNQLAT